MDYGLLIASIALTVFGLIMVYDSSVVQAYKDFGDKYYYIKQQLIWVVLGYFFLTFFAFFNYENFRKLALPILAGSFLLLLAVLIPGLGTAAGGAHRWLKLGPVSIQPAEIMKLASVIFFAAIFEKKPRFAPFALVVLAASSIIGIFQRDLGSTVVFVLISLAMFIGSGANLGYIWLMLPVSAAGFLFFVLSSAYRKQRVLAFLDPFADPQGFSYHISQVLIALGSGGLLGLGLGQSRQKFEYIPEVTTDSIFAIVGEEFGFIGALVLIGLLTFLIYKGFKIAEAAPDRFGKLLALGLTIWLGSQTVVNLGAMVSLIPLTGVPLPFISYGGSALLVNLVAIGILLNISKNTNR
ncbi:cell division protein FtsW [Candidatus Daviesbacteria bacterium RIFCSPHIGHO2_01_FULL_36_37]|nr:MAG: cell division protein FtsW [Candidatus Daviesbacteria bacterium RIFCSPHIGHO2_01_FULL_36_37]OGE36646.1 MAG: cell division protein FtsW [Candidatus Daviesbacteria bacterium RIFCSPHIGHO2_12_FULL_37_16]